jgi:hypothetical protein
VSESLHDAKAHRGPDEPSRRVVEQRVRNRIIEYLEPASSFEAQQQYERDVAIAHVPYELINQWEDWVHKDPREDRDLSDVHAGCVPPSGVSSRP